MKRFATIIFFCLVVGFVYCAPSNNWVWAQQGFGDGMQQTCGAVTDGTGCVYFTGYYTGAQFEIGDSVLQNSGVGNGDIFIVKYSPSGKILWARNIGSAGDEHVYSLAIDVNSNIYIAGYFLFSTITVGNITLTGAGTHQNLFVAKYDSAGNVLMAKRIDNDAPQNADAVINISAIYADNQQNFYLTGGYNGDSVVFGATTLKNPVPWSPNNNGPNTGFFLVKYSQPGHVLWAKGSSSPTVTSSGQCLTADTSGNVYVAGYCADTLITLGTLSLHHRFPYDNMFIAGYDSAGSAIWANEGQASNSYPQGICTDVNGNIYCTGNFEGQNITFGSYDLESTPSDAGHDWYHMYIAKYTAGGTFVWAKTASGAGGNIENFGYTIAAGEGGLFITGGFESDEFVYGGDSLILSFISSNHFSMFALNVDTNGNEICMFISGGSGPIANFICADNAGNAYIAGSFDTHDFFIGADTLNYNGTQNVFIGKFNCSGVSGIASINDNSSIQLHPNPFTSQAIVQYSLPTGSKNANLIIYDILGRERNSYQLSNPDGEIGINASNLSRGIYLYSLLVDGRVVVTKKMVVE